MYRLNTSLHSDSPENSCSQLNSSKTYGKCTGHTSSVFTNVSRLQKGFFQLSTWCKRSGLWRVKSNRRQPVRPCMKTREPYPVSARSIKSLNHLDSRLTLAQDHNERHCFGFRTEDIRSIWVWSQAWSIRLCRGYRFEFGSSIGWDACNRTVWC